MSNNPFQGPYLSTNQTQQSFNPYGSYASSNTYYDPPFNASSSKEGAGGAYGRDFDRAATPYSQDTNHGGGSHIKLTKAQNSYEKSKSNNLPGPYSQGPARSPSPTPSEIEDSKRGVVDWKKLLNWRTYAKVKYIPWFLALIVCIVLVALMTLYHKEIVHWLKPVADWMHEKSWGWVIPIVVLFVISFPPLFGHEIVAVLCGLVWGLWVGFGIVAAGTLLGEIGNYYAFKYCCSSRGEKLERQKLSYACLARVVREGGFKIALIARLSAIPGHFTTAVFSTCGMGIVVFTIAAILSMPKQFITVYLGVILEHSTDSPEEQAANKKSRLISNIVLAITILITVAAGWYIWKEMNRVKPIVQKERRLAKKKALSPAPEAQYLSRGSNVDLSEEDMVPVKENEARMGGFGYSGYGHVNASGDTLAGSTPLRGKYGGEQYQMKDVKRQSYGYPPVAPSPLSDNPYSPEDAHSYSPITYAPRQPSQHSHTTYEEDISTTKHSRISTEPPQINNISNLTGPRRQGREGWETSEGASTVGMGSWGGILKEGSEDPNTPRAQDFQYRQQEQAYQQPSESRRDGADEYGVLHQRSNSGGLGALGAPMGGGNTIMVTPRDGVKARQSVEVPASSGHVHARSMRAVIENSDDSDLAYARATSPTQYYTSGSHTMQGSEASMATFGQPRSLHSREYASGGSNGIIEERDEPFTPPTNRR
ncbi:hypothetical protein CPB86DRAFT_747201 [Serendipita vermifera]|nr:hypothetical protein CPB86DRAFT_747201 [Serendipita vermifera]